MDDSVVSVERRSERVMIVKLVIDNGLLNVLTVYALLWGTIQCCSRDKDRHAPQCHSMCNKITPMI